MEKCCICLAKRTKTLSLNERIQNVSYADMITSVANVKILGDDYVTNKICKSCCERLKEVYEFKLLIERSDALLKQISDSELKRISFDNISEIIIDLTQIKQENDVKEKENIQDIVTNFENGQNIVTYNNIVIKKVKNVCDKEFKMLSIADLFTKNEDDDYFYEIYNDDAQYENDETFLDDDFNIQENFEYTGAISLYRTRSGNTYARKKYECKRKCVKKNHEVDKDDDGKCDKPETNKKQNSATESKSNKLAFDKGTDPTFRIRPKIRNDLKMLSAKRKRQPQEEKEKSKICPQCGKLFKNMRSHYLSHLEKKYICDMCKRGFAALSVLRAHIKQTHSNEKPFKCDECFSVFFSLATLKIHKLVHKDKSERPHFTCEICTKKFTTKYLLDRHIFRHNSANRSVKCELCNMSFYDKYGLKHHMRVHTGERPYKCELCSRPYSYKHDFNRHCFKKHGIFLKRRLVYVLNEEVLAREREIMKELVLRANGFRTEGVPLNLFQDQGNSAWLAIDQAMRDLKQKKIDYSDLI